MNLQPFPRNIINQTTKRALSLANVLIDTRSLSSELSYSIIVLRQYHQPLGEALVSGGDFHPLPELPNKPNRVVILRLEIFRNVLQLVYCFCECREILFS